MVLLLIASISFVIKLRIIWVLTSSGPRQSFKIYMVLKKTNPLGPTEPVLEPQIANLGAPEFGHPNQILKFQIKRVSDVELCLHMWPIRDGLYVREHVKAFLTFEN